MANVLAATPAVAVPAGVLLSKADIAEMAGVQRSVVSKWISRGLGFPKPASGDRYDGREVIDWLVSNRGRKREDIEPELRLYTLVSLAERYGVSHPGGDFLAAVTALICLRFLHDEAERLDEEAHALNVIARVRALAADLDPGDERLLSEIRTIPRAAGWLVSAVDDFVEAAWNCREAFERVIAARARFGPAAAMSAGAETAVSPLLAQLIARLSGAPELIRRVGSIVVSDPAAGCGDLLAATAHLLGPEAEMVVTGAEADPDLARMARRRLAVHGVPAGDCAISASASAGSRAGADSGVTKDRATGGHADWPVSSAPPDVIVTQLPYQPGEERDARATLDALDSLAVELAPGRFGVVLGPADVLCGDLPPYSHGALARADLLKADMVEAIIRLPGGQVPYRPGYETALWVLTQARTSKWKGRVLTADVSDADLTLAAVDALVEDVVTWRREGYQPRAHRRSRCVERLVTDLVDPPRPLLRGGGHSGPPERKRDGDARVIRVTQHGVDLDRIGATATADRGHVCAETLRAADRRLATESIGTLAERGWLTAVSGTRIRPEHVTATGPHVVLGADEVLGVAPVGGRRLDRDTFAARYPRARLTEPGDVLVTLAPAPKAMVDRKGYSIAEFPVRVLRIPQEGRTWFTPRVLAAMLFADGVGRGSTRAAGAVRVARRLEEHRVPVLPPGEVTVLDELLARIEARRGLAQREIDLLDDLRRVALGGLIDGTLSLASDEEL